MARLGEAGLIERIEFDDAATTLKPTVASISDRNWSPPVARSWPYFITGVSEMWLHLIDAIAASEEAPPDSASLEELDAYYRRVNGIVTAHWQQEGRHALLHHLNALFGYEPLPIRF